jgi:hypothetical protein
LSTQSFQVKHAWRFAKLIVVAVVTHHYNRWPSVGKLWNYYRLGGIIQTWHSSMHPPTAVILIYRYCNLIIYSFRHGRPRNCDSIPGKGKSFLYSHSFQTGSRAPHHLVQWVQKAPPSGIKRLGRQADNSSPSSAEVKNVWSYTSTSPYIFMALCLSKHTDIFTFHLSWFIQRRLQLVRLNILYRYDDQ